MNFFQADHDIFGNSKPILSVDEDSYVIVPNMASFSDLDSTIDYDIAEDNHVAQIDYTYNDTYVGSAYVNLSEYAKTIYQFETTAATSDSNAGNNDIEDQEKGKTPAHTSSIQNSEDNDTIFINVKNVLIGVLIFAAFFICLFIIRALIINNNNSKRRKNRVNRKKHRRERVRSNFDDFDF